jgi:hypothetical protein
MSDLIGACWINGDGLGSLVLSCDFLELRNIIEFVCDCHLIGDFRVDPWSSEAVEVPKPEFGVVSELEAVEVLMVIKHKIYLSIIA